MKPEIKAQWLAALRSGEYGQTEGALRHEDRFCCLGVLCDLHAKAGLGTWESDRYLSISDVLPDAVIAWAELSDEVPLVNDAAITDLNDGVNGFHVHPFAEIADLIEAHL